jgi:hypothetical protein
MASLMLSFGASGCCGLPRPLLIAIAISSSYKKFFGDLCNSTILLSILLNND